MSSVKPKGKRITNVCLADFMNSGKKEEISANRL